MSNFIPRTITENVIRQKEKFPALAVTGPRQSGKTTLLKNTFSDYEYVSLENPDNRAFASEDPNGFLNRYDKFVILDEVQRVPKLLSYIQTKVDESRLPAQYILSGSQNFHLIESITQTLAGRIALFKLLPFDFQELKNKDLLADSHPAVTLKGFYPPIFDRDIEPAIFYRNYIQTYIERDVSEIVNLHNVRTFRTFIGLCANTAGQLLNLSNLARSAGISHATASSWISILESSYIIFLLQPYYENFRKRLIKSPKIYFYDTGLLSHLLRITRAKEAENNKWQGSIFENLIVAELLKINEHRYQHRDYYFWRDSNQHEIDLLTREADELMVFEIKSGQTVKSSHFKEMDYFEKIAAPNVVHKNLIYGGRENQRRTNYHVISWYDISEK